MDATTPRPSPRCVPVLDVARGVVAGYQLLDDGASTRSDTAGVTQGDAAALRAALTVRAELPSNTFLSIPLSLAALTTTAVQEALADAADLGGVVLDVTHFTSDLPDGAEDALGSVRAAGARIAVGGEGLPQPDLTSIVRLRPSIIRLGRAWVVGVDLSASKRSTIEVTGRLAGQLDAWILADGVETAAELRALADLEVPLAQGPFVGSAGPLGPPWPSLGRAAGSRPSPGSFVPDGALRALTQVVPGRPEHDTLPGSAPEGTVVVLLDDVPRPAALATRTGTSWQTRPAMTVFVDTPARDALTRALARDRTQRLDPIVCTDVTGRYLGVVPIDRLTAHVLAERPTQS